MASERVLKAALNRLAADRLKKRKEAAMVGDFISSDMAVVQDVYHALHEVLTACVIARERAITRYDDPDALVLAASVGTFGQRVVDAAHDLDGTAYDDLIEKLDAAAASAVDAGMPKNKKKKKK